MGRRILQVGSGLVVVTMAVTDILFDWADRGDPWASWFMLLCSPAFFVAAWKRW